MFRRSTLPLILAAALVAQEPPTFQTTTRLVEVNVIATDENGPVGDLTKDDFRLFDNGKRQEIAFFTVNSRGSAAQGAEDNPAQRPPGEFSNRPLDGSGDPGGAVLIVFDMLRTPFVDLPKANRAIIENLRVLRPDDRVGVYILRFSIGVLQDYTSDSRTLIAAVEKRAEWPDLLTFLIEMPGFRGPVREVTGRIDPPSGWSSLVVNRLASERITLAIREISDHLAQVPGRKSVIWVGSSAPPGSIIGAGDIAVYPVDPRGLLPVPSIRTGVGTASMRRRAGDSGGVAFVNNDDLTGAIETAIRDGDHTYTLGYYLSELSKAQDPMAPRRIRVDVNRRGVDLRHRRVYQLAMNGGRLPTREATMDYAALSGLDSRRIGIQAQLTRDDAPCGSRPPWKGLTSLLSRPMAAGPAHWTSSLSNGPSWEPNSPAQAGRSP